MTINSESQFVYVCQNCQELFEDFTSSCDLCGRSEIEKVHKGDMGMDEETEGERNMTNDDIFYSIFDINDSDIEELVDTTTFEGVKEFILGLWMNPNNEEEDIEGDKVESILNKPGVTFDELNELALGCDYEVRKELTWEGLFKH
ncbi:MULTISPECIES: hypothetical protein [Bacillaceae]|uniref:Uncharacterized protein n=1 Tax=Cytobacillus purgationiresistens TaxID=863449 RepID=A0ABU0AIR6_9BACI|nr:hypothetical protein [Cytobacillus purgationiresistens]MDQ0271153.1 hypothetical protein [Cytobacillus purgationiresistens]